MKYVLTGSLGNITKSLAQRLINAHHEVTVISSSEDRKQQIEALGAKAAIGNIEDVNFLSKTFSGADAVYTMIPPVHDSSNWKQHIHNMGKNYAEAIKASGVKHVVNLSSVGAHMAEGCGPVSGIHFAEQELDALNGVDILHLRPGYFYINLYATIGMIKHAGIFGNNFGADSLIPLSHPRDIAESAANHLLALDFKGKSHQYISSDESTSKEIAKAIGTAIGKADLPYVEFTDEDNLQGALKAGLPKELASNFTEMGAALRSGEMIADYKKEGITPTGKVKLNDFLRDFAGVYAHA